MDIGKNVPFLTGYSGHPTMYILGIEPAKRKARFDVKWIDTEDFPYNTDGDSLLDFRESGKVSVQISYNKTLYKCSFECEQDMINTFIDEYTASFFGYGQQLVGLDASDIILGLPYSGKFYSRILKPEEYDKAAEIFLGDEIHKSHKCCFFRMEGDVSFYVLDRVARSFNDCVEEANMYSFGTLDGDESDNNSARVSLWI